MKPADAEEKWFWEQCGFKHIPLVLDGTQPVETWLYPDGITLAMLPPIDLNNLFKYAVPEVGKRGMILNYTKIFNSINPVLTLFWAIFKALGGVDAKEN